jgi:predicted permease
MSSRNPRARRSIAERVYGALLYAHPAEFRRAYGDQMCETFRDQLHDVRDRAGHRGAARVVFRALGDLAVTATAEHIAQFQARGHPAALARRSTTSTGHLMMNTLWQDVRFAARMLRKHPGFTVVALAVIALGTGAVSTIFSAANAIVLQSVPGVSRPSEIMTIDRTRANGRGSLSASYAYYQRLAGASHTMSGIAAWSMLDMTVSSGGEAVRSVGNIVSGNYFDVLGVHPALGRFFSGDETRVRDTYPVVVLSHEFWQRHFAGDSSVVGRSLLLNGTKFTVVGVAPAKFSGLFPVVRTDAWVPLMMQREVRPGGDLLSSPGSCWLELFGRLAPGVSRDAARTELATITKQVAGSPSSGEPHDLANYSGARVARASGLPSDAGGAVFTFFIVLLVVAALVLLIASVNVASMLLARAVARRREIGVRIALGAGRARLVRQLLTESVMLFVVGGAGGTLLAVYGTRLLEHINLPVDVPLSLDLTPDLRVLGVTLLVAFVTGVIFGLAPALQGSALDIATSLRGDTAGAGRQRSRLRNALVVGQVAMSLLLLAVSGLFIRALDRGRRVDVGFDASHVATAALNVGTSAYDSTRGRALYGALEQRLAAQPGVSAVGFARLLPLSMNTSGTDISVPGYTPPDAHEGNTFTVLDDIVDGGYFAATRIPLLHGRLFDGTDTERSPRVAVVNATFAGRMWPGRSAIGRTFLLDSATVTVVGVVRDAKYGKLDEPPTPFMYLPSSQQWRADVNLLVRTTGDAAQLGPVIRRELRALDPNLPPPTITTLEQVTSVVLLPQRVAVLVTGILGFAGLLLAGIGLYGVLSFSTAQRTREIGVRIALGATRGDVLGLVVREGLELVSVGMGIGIGLALLATRALTPFLFGVSPWDALTFVAIAATLGATAFVASYLPARRAASLDPIAALRQD